MITILLAHQQQLSRYAACTGSIPSKSHLRLSYGSEIICIIIIVVVVVVVVFIIIVISDPRRGRYMVLHAFIFLSFFFFFRHDFVRAISLEPSLVETPN